MKIRCIQTEKLLAWNENDRCRRTELNWVYCQVNNNSGFKLSVLIFCKVSGLIREREETCCFSIYEWHSISFQKTNTEEMSDGTRQASSVCCTWMYREKWDIIQTNCDWLVKPTSFLQGKGTYCNGNSAACEYFKAFWIEAIWDLITRDIHVIEMLETIRWCPSAIIDDIQWNRTNTLVCVHRFNPLTYLLHEAESFLRS